MKNWKTTVSGLISALGAVLPTFGVSQEVSTAVVTVGLALLGFFSKDHSTSGTGV